MEPVQLEEHTVAVVVVDLLLAKKVATALFV
jgi:hypothetical protein